jgi:pre-mRNA-splicing factor ATP-dependent RNA helicase DHX38/PRP16
LTPLGKKMAQFPLDPTLARMLLASDELKCTEEILTIVSMLNAPSIFDRPKDTEADAAKEKLFIAESDHLTYLNIYE